MQNIVIIGAGGVAGVTAHKCAQHNDVLGDICIASRTQDKCNSIIDSIHAKKDGQEKEVFIYNICDHEKCFAEVGSQAISYTAGVPPVAAAMLVMNSTWDTKRLVNMEELDPDPFLNLVGKIGLPTEILEIRQ